MSRALLVLASPASRKQAIDWCERAPAGTRLEFKGPRRSLPQNSLLWLRLTDIATQVPWHGIHLSTDDWRLIFLDALKREMRLVPNLDGTGFVNLGRSSSDLSKADFADLLTLIEMFAANHGAILSDQDSTPLQPAELEHA